MKTFNAPVIDVEKLNIIDVITASGDDVCDADCATFAGCPNDTCLTD